MKFSNLILAILLICQTRAKTLIVHNGGFIPELHSEEPEVLEPEQYSDQTEILEIAELPEPDQPEVSVVESDISDVEQDYSENTSKDESEVSENEPEIESDNSENENAIFNEKEIIPIEPEEQEPSLEVNEVDVENIIVDNPEILPGEQQEPIKNEIPIIRLVSNHGDFLTTDDTGRVFASEDISRRNQWKVHLYENSLKFWLQNIFSEKFLHQSPDERLTTWHGGLGNIWEVIGGDIKDGERVQLKSFYGHFLHRSQDGNDEIGAKKETEIDDKVLTKREHEEYWRLPHQWIVKSLHNYN